MAVGQALETDSAFPVTAAVVQIVVIGLATETDSAFPVTVDKAYLIGIAIETDIALSVILVKEVYTVHILNVTTFGFDYRVYRITETGVPEDVTASVPINWIAVQI